VVIITVKGLDYFIICVMPQFAECTLLIYRYEGRISADMLCHGVVQSVLISILPRPHSIIKVVPSKAKIVVNFI